MGLISSFLVHFHHWVLLCSGCSGTQENTLRFHNTNPDQNTIGALQFLWSFRMDLCMVSGAPKHHYSSLQQTQMGSCFLLLLFDASDVTIPIRLACALLDRHTAVSLWRLFALHNPTSPESLPFLWRPFTSGASNGEIFRGRASGSSGKSSTWDLMRSSWMFTLEISTHDIVVFHLFAFAQGFIICFAYIAIHTYVCCSFSYEFLRIFKFLFSDLLPYFFITSVFTRSLTFHHVLFNIWKCFPLFFRFPAWF